MCYVTELPSPVGRLTLASDGTSLTGLWLEGQKYHGAGLPKDVRSVKADRLPVFAETGAWLDAYFHHRRLSLPCRPWPRRGQLPAGGVAAAAGDPARYSLHVRRSGKEAPGAGGSPALPGRLAEPWGTTLSPS